MYIKGDWSCTKHPQGMLSLQVPMGWKQAPSKVQLPTHHLINACTISCVRTQLYQSAINLRHVWCSNCTSPLLIVFPPCSPGIVYHAIGCLYHSKSASQLPGSFTRRSTRFPARHYRSVVEPSLLSAAACRYADLQHANL